MPKESSSTVVVATHGHCFDGMASAVAFTRLHGLLHPGQRATFSYRACDYGPGDSSLPEGWFSGADNALLDFRYAPSPHLTWYFDHHGTAFRTNEDRAHFDAAASRRFYDPAYPSCTKLIADVARRDFGLELRGLEELVGWADIIDSARFPSAEAAVLRSAPELQLMTVVEHQGTDSLLAEMVPRLLERPLSEVARSGDVRARYLPLEAKRQRVIARMRERSEARGAVAFCDLSGELTEVAEKFAMYLLFPLTSYSVVLSRTASRVKISIGHNPWSGRPRLHDIGQICKRFGGGGHPVVGAITLPAAEAERARALARTLAAEIGG